MLKTTAGRLAVNYGLPDDVKDSFDTLDDAGAKKLLQAVAEKHPDKYRDIAQHLMRVGQHTSTLTGGHSFDLKHLRQSPAAVKAQQDIKRKVYELYTNPRIPDGDKEKQLVDYLYGLSKPLEDQIFKESVAENNPIAMQVLSKARGNKSNLKSLRGMDLLYVDHKNRPIPIPITHSYSQGLSPVEYYAGTFGARAGVIQTKFNVADSGYLSKKLIQATHRLLVTANDHKDTEHRDHLGMPVATEDADNAGGLLSRAAGGYPRNTVLTPKVISDLKRKGVDNILIRSPIVGGPADGGVYAKDVGVRERGNLAPTGDFVGIAASQSLGEQLSQGQLSGKHSGGVAGAGAGSISGFRRIEQFVEIPKTFRGGAAHAQIDGRVGSVETAPQGGSYVNVNGHKHYVGTGYNVAVKPGSVVEAGDILSDGLPNPAEIVKHKGIGEGRRYFTHLFKDAFEDSGMRAHRRNIELIARGLIDHVRLTHEHGGYIPGDIMPYSRVEADWEPREGYERKEPKAAHGMYLEEPVLHYSIGTRIRPSVSKQLDQFGIKKISVHKEPPPFEPEMIRGMENISHDPDWLTRFLGSHLEKNLLKGVHRGAVSDESGTSYVPALARGVDFGRSGPIKSFTAPKHLKLEAT